MHKVKFEPGCRLPKGQWREYGDKVEDVLSDRGRMDPAIELSAAQQDQFGVQ